MNSGNVFSVLFLTSTLAACGGGSSDTDTSTSSSSSSSTYNYVIPAVGTKRAFARTITDNASNKINQSYTETVTAASATSFSQSIIDPTATSQVVNGTTYRIAPLSRTINASGQVTAEIYNIDQTNPNSCTFTPSEGGVAYPLSIGQTWNAPWSERCSLTTPRTATDSGLVVDLETVTVPAGTFSTVKVQGVTSFQVATGSTLTQNTTQWRDVNTGLVVQLLDTYSYSGAVPSTGYATQIVTVLQSQS